MVVVLDDGIGIVCEFGDGIIDIGCIDVGVI